jgi:hypothetical protein
MTNAANAQISSAAYVIQKLGGLTKTANALGIPITTVQGWRDRDKIPSDHWLSVIEALGSVGVEWEVSDFLRRHPTVAAAEQAA